MGAGDPESGALTLAGFGQAVRSGDLSHAAMEFTVLDARRHGDVVRVRAHGTNHDTFRGEPFQADEWVTEVFVRHDDRWRCTVSALTPRDPAGSRLPGGITPYHCVDDTRRALADLLASDTHTGRHLATRRTVTRCCDSGGGTA